MEAFFRGLCGPGIFLLCIFCSCSAKPLSWKIDKIETPNPAYNSSRFLTSGKNAQFEIYKTAHEIVAYFCVTSLPIPELPTDPTKCVVNVCIEGDEEAIVCHRITGGQKILLPEVTLNKILVAMKCGHEVLIKTGRYSLKVDPIPKNELQALL